MHDQNPKEWRKFDFHTHTPASKDHRSNHKEEVVTPKEWLSECMRKEIDCVAITDHNTGIWIDRLKQAYQELRKNNYNEIRELFIFPGVEVTALNNIHILGIFDLPCNSHTIATLLKDLEFKSNDFGKKKSISPLPSNKVIKKIHSSGGLAIPAHVDKDNGLFVNETKQNIKQVLKNKDLIAIEVIHDDFIKPDIYLQSKLHLAEVRGTDTHSKSTIGSNYTWVHMKNHH